MQAQQNFVNEPLKGLRCIPESEQHLEVDFRENSRAGEGRGEEYVVYTGLGLCGYSVHGSHHKVDSLLVSLCNGEHQLLEEGRIMMPNSSM